MALSQHLVQKQTQRLVITQDLRQSIELLPLSNLELQDRIQKEILENPLLEESGDGERNATPDAALYEQRDSERADLARSREEGEGDGNWQSAWEDSGGEQRPRDYSAAADSRAASRDYNRIESGDYGSSYGGAEKTEKKHQFLQNAVSSSESLADHLLWQLRLSDLTPEQLDAGEYVISAIDDHGFLAEDLEDLVSGAEISLEDARAALERIYELDPVGCGARNIAESLYVQAQILRPDDEVGETARRILRDHFEDLEKLDYKKIEREAGLSREEIEAAMQFIRTLEPYPGTLHAPRQPEYIVPDVIIAEIEGRMEVLINDDWLPGLQVNDEYRGMLRESGKQSEDREYLQSKLNSAQWLIKSIRQRRQTLYRVMKEIVRFQEDFFREGHGRLKPLTLRMVAEEVELHESTVSRITTNKYAQTRWGVFELKYFFSSSLKSSGGGGGKHSARSIQDRIKQLVEEEDAENPLSDQQIVDRIEKEGVQIARRTVAKYRKLLRILPADRRKKVNQLNSGRG